MIKDTVPWVPARSNNRLLRQEHQPATQNFFGNSPGGDNQNQQFMQCIMGQMFRALAGPQVPAPVVNLLPRVEELPVLAPIADAPGRGSDDTPAGDAIDRMLADADRRPRPGGAMRKPAGAKTPAAAKVPSKAVRKVAKGTSYPTINSMKGPFPGMIKTCRIYMSDKDSCWRVQPKPGLSEYKKDFSWKGQTKAAAWAQLLSFCKKPSIPETSKHYVAM